MTSKLLIASIVNALILFVVFVILKFSMVTTLDAAARMSIGVTWLGIQLLNVVLLGSFTFQHKRLGVSIKELNPLDPHMPFRYPLRYEPPVSISRWRCIYWFRATAPLNGFGVMAT